jgi:hypothetical protein
MRTDKTFLGALVSLLGRRLCRRPVRFDPARVAAVILGCGCLAAAAAPAAEIVIAADGRSDWQIVVPDDPESPAIAAALARTAALVEVAFRGQGAMLPVVAEKDRDPARPAILLGATRAARAAGIDTGKLAGWGYVQKVAGRDLILAGHDHPARAPADDPRRPNWDRIGTAKAVTDFLRERAGVRFLYPEIIHYQPLGKGPQPDLLESPALEFLPTSRITVPSDLDVRKTPLLRLNTGHPAGSGFYDIALNRFPRVDECFGSHTWERAVPPEKHFADHPEYFALLGGERRRPEPGNAQYCLANEDFQELVYRDIARLFDAGYDAVDLGQPDGFRPCECESCARLYDTGADWGEKIWVFNRRLAERLAASHPGKQVTMMSYILTAAPPKSFTTFPANTGVMITGTNEEDIAPWRRHEVPRGFTGYLYNWCPNLATRYTPMRTPAFVAAQAKRLAENRIGGLLRDAPGQLFGLEGHVYYVMGRMFDDPATGSAAALVKEFVDAAYGRAAPAMRSFHERLDDSIALYSDHLGTRCDLWQVPGPDGRRRKSVTDPFRLLGFLYPPSLLAALEADLAQAERLADTAKVRTRLALVRREFDYLRHLATVVHLHQAYEAAPDGAARDRLLDAIDARNTFIDSLYEKPRAPPRPGDFAFVLFPYAGHGATHLRLAYDLYQEPYANTCFNWDTASLRNAPAPGKKRAAAVRTAGPVDLDAAAWDAAAAHELVILPPLNSLPRKSTVKLLHDAGHLYVRVESDLEPDGPPSFPAAGRDRDLRGQEAVHVALVPRPGREVVYRFSAGPDPKSYAESAAGLVTDAMDPRHGRDDPDWNGDWRRETRVDAKSRRWLALVAIPWKALNTEPPAPGAVWQAQVARTHALPRGRTDRAVWSSLPGSTSIDDRANFGEIEFEAAPSR